MELWRFTNLGSRTLSSIYVAPQIEGYIFQQLESTPFFNRRKSDFLDKLLDPHLLKFSLCTGVNDVFFGGMRELSLQSMSHYMCEQLAFSFETFQITSILL